jgi:hypothetical protein
MLSEDAGKGYGNDWQHEIKPYTTCNSWKTILLVKKRK